MPRGTLSNYCERCGRRVDVRGARPGERDLGLDRINAAFRYCSTCQLFIGRTCCWNADVLACSGCAPLGSDQAAIFPAAIRTRKEFAIRRLADLTESVDDLQKVAKVLDARTAGGVAPSATTWGDAWDAASWLIARADTSRDAVARALWPPPADPANDKFEQFRDELADLMKAYLAARASVEQRLTAANRPLRAEPALKRIGWIWAWPRGWRGIPKLPALKRIGWIRAWPRGLRGIPKLPALKRISWIWVWPRGWRGAPMLPALLGAVAAVLVIAGGLAILSGRATEMAILGGQGSPDQTPLTGGGAEGSPASAETPTSAVTPTPDSGSEPTAPWVRADLDFDMLRIGTLQGASDSIGDIVGLNEVVPFPSPFDRSIRMAGSGSHRFCVSIPGLEARDVSVAVDLYAESSPFGAFELAAVPSDGPTTATGIPSEVVTSMLPGRWYHVSARWQPGMPGTIEIRDGQGGELVSELIPASVAAPAGTVEGLCLSASGIASDGELMLDNLRVEQ